MSFRIDGEVDPARFMPWINLIAQREGPKILRSKGIMAFKDEPRRFVFQGVHMILDGDLQRAADALSETLMADAVAASAAQRRRASNQNQKAS